MEPMRGAAARGIRFALTVLVAGSVAGALIGCSAAAPPEPAAPTATDGGPAPAPAPAVGEPVDLATGLAAPWSVAFLADGTPLVSERDTGRILELSETGEAREVGVIAGIRTDSEAGLLGLAVDEGDRLYVYSTGAAGNRIQRFVLRGDPGGLALGSPETILDGIPAASFHDGGRLAFGPDGMLYATTGDAGDRPASQDLGSLAGKILRMTPGGDVPADNPFDGSLVYSYGHRNVQGIAWADEGTMFASEFGQDTWDELNVIEPGGNYGWPDVEGTGGGDGFIDPVQQWNPDEASPSGMARVGDTLYLANLRGQVLRAVPVADPTQHEDLFAGEYGRLRDAVAAPDGSLWVLTNNTDGRGSPRDGDDRVLRIEVDG
ncbi:PQQ-dependent sugar dehydrogenase [Agromyces mangrovi Wang et al. 2018]|uniref:PQQ-dependent sugar dehydrogenase n=1 Tax=Agromyces mangrovi TaxID=1858653 RepID=UPI002573B920|nr:PQQ-dependent sugar dehydrogenase [Agromyces mangrovi]BDZ64961.1 oxidoreductase [Agromyces mangrovi]